MNNRSIFWGVILIVIGFSFLAFNLNWVDFDVSLRAIARFWPLLFILAGVSALISKERTPITPIMIALAIPLALFHFVDNGVHSFKHDLNSNWNFNDNSDDDKDGNPKQHHSGEVIKQDYSVENETDIKEANLNLKGGAAKFDLALSDSKLFMANTELSSGSYMMSEDKKDGIKTIDFDMKNRKGNDDDNTGGVHMNFHEGNIDNSVHLKLNPKTIWNLDMGIGAGDLDFDLTAFTIKNINLETGAASIKLKLSDKAALANVKVKSGVAAVTLEVPQNSGCQITSQGALSANDFQGFQKIGDVWQTPNFDKATKKIIIDAQSGLSSLKVLRY